MKNTSIYICVCVCIHMYNRDRRAVCVFDRKHFYQIVLYFIFYFYFFLMFSFSFFFIVTQPVSWENKRTSLDKLIYTCWIVAGLYIYILYVNLFAFFHSNDHGMSHQRNPGINKIYDPYTYIQCKKIVFVCWLVVHLHQIFIHFYLSIY